MDKIIDLPYFKQDKDHTCGPAVIQMVLAFYGRQPRSQEELSIALKTTSEDGTPHENLKEFILKEGFQAVDKAEAELEDIRGYIDEGVPVIVNFIEPENNEGHYAVAVGYNDSEIILNDPWHGPAFRMGNADFVERWRNSTGELKRWMMAVFR